MILCLLSTNWLTTTKFRQGLWQFCIDPDSPRPLPFGIEAHDGCHWGRDAAYIKLAGFFAVACFLLSLIATVLTSFGLSSRDPNRKYTLYRFALYINLAACKYTSSYIPFSYISHAHIHSSLVVLSVMVALILYPAFFYTELHHTNAVPANRPHWYFGWAYGVAWGASIFLIGAALLLICDKETEEIYYKERTIVQANGHHHLPFPRQQQQQHHHQQQQHQQLLRNQMYMMPPQMVKT